MASSNTFDETLRKVTGTVKKITKRVKPYMPQVTRVLLTATFFEDGLRAFAEWTSQVSFLRNEYRIPSFLAGTLLVITTLISLIGAVLIILKKHDKIAAYIMMGFIFYQQVLYGRHSPIGSGNLGFLVRNLCLAGSMLLLYAQARMKEGKSAIPGLLDAGGDQNTTIEYLRLGARILIALLSLEFVTTLGPVGTFLTLPVIGAVLVGYKCEVSGFILLLIYFVHNVMNSAFWFVDTTTRYGKFEQEVKRYEFVQTLSIMGGLLLLVSTGSGSLSLDERIQRRKQF